ncbi:hypothetical protein ACFL1H_00460 [Nanoarchaeota archaeon]
MLSEKELMELHTNQRLLIIELQNRNIDVNILFQDLEIIEASYNDHKELIMDRDSSINPYAASVICGDKYLTKKLLFKAELSAMKGEQFYADQFNKAIDYAKEIGYPVVVKPTYGSHGYDVYMDLEDKQQVKKAINKVIEIIGKSDAFLIEEQFEGKEYRVFVTKENDYAVLHRDPAHVIGDGKRTIKQIAKDESKDRKYPRKNSLCPIMLDDIAKEYLAITGKDFSYIPKNNEKIYLRHTSNVAMGGMCEDYTDKVHPSVIEISKKALDVFHGLPYAGMDFLSKDITIEQTPDMYRIIEVNSIPGIHMHMRPGMGKPRNVAKYIVDMMFPESK